MVSKVLIKLNNYIYGKIEEVVNGDPNLLELRSKRLTAQQSGTPLTKSCTEEMGLEVGLIWISRNDYDTSTSTLDQYRKSFLDFFCPTFSLEVMEYSFKCTKCNINDAKRLETI